jgi:ubiquinone/menaquinone biosynthesis C-methylase UbiE
MTDDRMSNFGFKFMAFTMAVEDWLFPRMEVRVPGFGIEKGMTLVDYGCGPARYTLHLARAVGDYGTVYAVDIHEAALEIVRRKIKKHGFVNILPTKAHGYAVDIRDHSVDMIFALNMLYGVKDPVALLDELHRIIKPEGTLIVDEGHQPRRKIINRLSLSDRWEIREARIDHLRCVPK